MERRRKKRTHNLLIMKRAELSLDSPYERLKLILVALLIAVKLCCYWHYSLWCHMAVTGTAITNATWPQYPKLKLYSCTASATM